MTEAGDRTLAVDARIDRIAERSLELLSDESQQMLLQLLSRRKTEAPEPPEKPSGTPPEKPL